MYSVHCLCILCNVLCKCVLDYCHRVPTQLQLNINNNNNKTYVDSNANCGEKLILKDVKRSYRRPTVCKIQFQRFLVLTFRPHQ